MICRPELSCAWIQEPRKSEKYRFVFLCSRICSSTLILCMGMYDVFCTIRSYANKDKKNTDEQNVFKEKWYFLVVTTEYCLHETREAYQHMAEEDDEIEELFHLK